MKLLKLTKTLVSFVSIMAFMSFMVGGFVYPDTGDEARERLEKGSQIMKPGYLALDDWKDGGANAPQIKQRNDIEADLKNQAVPRDEVKAEPKKKISGELVTEYKLSLLEFVPIGTGTDKVYEGVRLISEVIDGKRCVYVGFDNINVGTNQIQDAIDKYAKAGDLIMVRGDKSYDPFIVKGGLSIYGGYDDFGIRNPERAQTIIEAGELMAYTPAGHGQGGNPVSILSLNLTDFVEIIGFKTKGGLIGGFSWGTGDPYSYDYWADIYYNKLGGKPLRFVQTGQERNVAIKGTETSFINSLFNKENRGNAYDMIGLDFTTPSNSGGLKEETQAQFGHAGESGTNKPEDTEDKLKEWLDNIENGKYHDFYKRLASDIYEQAARGNSKIFSLMGERNIDSVLVLNRIMNEPTETEKEIIETAQFLEEDLEKEGVAEPGLKQASDDFIRVVANVLLAQALPDLLTEEGMRDIRMIFDEFNKEKTEIFELYRESINPYYEDIKDELIKNRAILEVKDVLSPDMKDNDIKGLSRKAVDSIIERLKKEDPKTEKEKAMLKKEAELRQQYLNPALTRLEENLRFLLQSYTRQLTLVLEGVGIANKEKHE